MPDANFWTPIYNAFNPWERLWGDKLDAFFVEREHSPLGKLMMQIRPEHDVQKTLLVGHRGSGKSSELLKLVREIGDDFFTVWFDANLNLDIFSANQVELLFLLGAAVYRVAERESLNPNREHLDLLIDCLQTLVREHTQRTDYSLDAVHLLENIVCFGLPVIAGAVAGPVVGAGVAALTALARELAQDTFSFSLGVGQQEVARLEVEPRTRDIARAVNLIIADVEQKAGKRVLMVVDGLDKLDPTPARDIFIKSQVLSLPACRVIYVTPITIYYSPDFSQTRQQFAMAPFPNVKLSHQLRPNIPYTEGLDTMIQVIYRRLHALGYKPQHIVSKDALRPMAQMSGGVMREMVSLMREAVTRASIEKETTITETTARAATYELRRQYAAGLRREHYQELESFRDGGGIPSQSEECDELLRNLYILSYVNDSFWYDVHPNVRPLLEGIRSRAK